MYVGIMLCDFWDIPSIHGWNYRFVHHFIHSNNRLHHFRPYFRKKFEGTKFYNRFFHIFIQGRFFGFITHYVISLPFRIVPTDTIKDCGPHSKLNFLESVWNFSAFMKCKMFAITAVPFHNDTSPRILYVKHHQTGVDGWVIHSLCSNCRNDFKINIRNLIYNRNLSENCTCNLCLRQPPLLRGLV